MKLEDTIRGRLFRPYVPAEYNYINNIPNNSFVIECKADRQKPVPLCIPESIISHNDLVYKQLYLHPSRIIHERSTSRALFNALFGGYFPSDPLIEVKMKDIIYYYAPGVLFDEEKNVLFYFAKELAEQAVIPRLYITPRLLLNSGTQGKPMEKFFMSTIIPFLMVNEIHLYPGEFKVIVEIDNCPDDVFFVPHTSISQIPVEHINDRLNDALANNSDVICTFMEIYRNN